MKFSRVRKIENNVFETVIKFKAYGGDGVYDEEGEKRLINDFGAPCIEIGYVKGTYEVTSEDGQPKVISVEPLASTVAKHVFEDEFKITESEESEKKYATVCEHKRGHKSLDEKFSVTLKLPIKNASGTPCELAKLTSDELSVFEAKCRVFEETIIARAKSAMKELYGKDTTFETEDSGEIILAVNEAPEVVEDVHAKEDIFIG